MNWNTVMGLVSTIALSIPIITILATRLTSYRVFPALLAYYIVVMGYNLLTEGYVNVSPAFIRYYGITNNLLDAPLILTFLTYFSTSTALTRKMQIITAVFAGFELVVLAIFGFTVKTITITMGPGLLLVLAFSGMFFFRQTRITIMHQKATGKALMIAAILFAYGCFSIIYIMYYLLKEQNVADTFLVYFMVSTFSSLLMSAGIIIDRRRVKKLAELKVTRKELSDLYGENKTAAPLKTAIFDFDREQWN